MNSIEQKMIRTLQKIGEDIETISLTDCDAWKNICTDLERDIRDIPEDMSGVLKLLGFCLKGLHVISEKSVTDSLSLVVAISDALSASEQYLLNNPNRDLLVREAGQALGNVLNNANGEGDVTTAVNPVHSEEFSSLSLDDAAALLIQLEPNDCSGLSCLLEMLNTFAADESYPVSSRENIVHAAQKIQKITEANVSDPNLTFDEVGKLIEKAINAMDEIGSDEEIKTPVGSISEQDDKPAAENLKADYMPEDVDLDLLDEFITEGNELVLNAEDALLSLEIDPDDTDAIGTVFRAFHSIKGTSAFLDLSLISEMGHYAESLLSRVRDREIRYSGGYADLALRALDMFKILISSVQKALGGNPFFKPEGYDELLGLLADPEKAGISDETDESTDILLRTGDILVAQGKVEREEIEKLASRQDDGPIGMKLVESEIASVTDVAHALRTGEQMKGAKQEVESSIRVNIKRLDQLIDMVGELVIAHSMVAQDEVVVNGNHHDLLKKITHTNKIVRELQDISMSMRMIPLKSTFRKMARLVRDVARKVNKNVNFITEGEDTEIDRNMVDIINDPLVHMVRNAVDHGIEPPETRKKTGKSQYGTVKLSAYHSAGNVVIEIKDDGKGLDREAILVKARERGLVSDGTSLSDREVFNLIFEPGFSTAETVTELSGRGVGMDVVKKNLEALRGQAEIQSEAGKGSVFKMSLPLTLAIIDGMVIRVGCEKYVIPTASIIRSIKPDPKDLSTVLNQGEILTLQGKIIPLFRLDALFGIEGAEQDASKALVVVIEDEDRQAGLFIDELIGRQQVVIKTLGETMRDIPGISGGAVMPNGRVGLILDAGGLVKLVNVENREEVSG